MWCLMRSCASKYLTDGKRLAHLGHEWCKPGAFTTRGYSWRPQPHPCGLQLRPEANCLLQPAPLHSPHAGLSLPETLLLNFHASAQWYLAWHAYSAHV